MLVYVFLIHSVNPVRRLRDFRLPSLFWDTTQCTVAVLYRRFGTTYLFHLQWSRNLAFLDRGKWERTIVLKRR